MAAHLSCGILQQYSCLNNPPTLLSVQLVSSYSSASHVVSGAHGRPSLSADQPFDSVTAAVALAVGSVFGYMMEHMLRTSYMLRAGTSLDQLARCPRLCRH